METHEIGLLVAVTLPVAVIVAMNILLALAGERGTLLLPSLAPYPAVQMPPLAEAGADAVAAAAGVAGPAVPAPARAPREEPAFDEAEEPLVEAA